MKQQRSGKRAGGNAEGRSGAGLGDVPSERVSLRPGTGAVRGADRSSGGAYTGCRQSPLQAEGGEGLGRDGGRGAHLSRARSLPLQPGPSGHRRGRAAKGRHCC